MQTLCTTLFDVVLYGGEQILVLQIAKSRHPHVPEKAINITLAHTVKHFVPELADLFSVSTLLRDAHQVIEQ